jgi:hypothetical protein
MAKESFTIEKGIAPPAGMGRPPKEGKIEEVPAIPREPLRADMHEDPRERAKRKTQEIMGHLGDLDAGNADKYYIPPEIIPPGWGYEWKRWSVLNQENPHYINSLRRTGWDFVPASRHPSYIALGSTEKIIIMDGMVLMERPLEVTAIMSAHDKQKAADQVRAKEQQLTRAPDGQFERDNKGQPISSHGVAGVKKTYSPMPIPD